MGPFSRLVTVTAAALATALSAVSTRAQTVPSGHTGTLAGRARERLRVLHAEADRLVLEERTVLRQLRQLELSRQIAGEEFAAVTAEVAAAVSAVAATDERIRQLEAQRDRERPALEARLVDVYKLGKGRYTRLLLSTANVTRMGQASRAVSALAARDQARLTAFHSRLDSLGQARAALDAERRELDRRRQKALSAEAAARGAIAARSALVHDIDHQRDLNAKLASELETARHRLEAAVADTKGSATPIGLPIGPFRGALPWPIAANSRLAAAWRHPAGRSGVGLATDEGTPVQAVHDGTVAFAGSFEGFGNLVIVDHGERTYSLYGDLLEMAVGRGIRVERGAAIGRTGTTPTGESALYFELRVAGRPVDPIEWLSRHGEP